jgi:DNA-3-methyladenine glycosylase I
VSRTSPQYARGARAIPRSRVEVDPAAPVLTVQTPEGAGRVPERDASSRPRRSEGPAVSIHGLMRHHRDRGRLKPAASAGSVALRDQARYDRVRGRRPFRREGRMRRCEWAQGRHEIRYHDREWGVPLYDDRRLFELLILEGAQAGLSWSIILRRRPAYRRAFDRFDPRKVARYTAQTVRRLLADPGIIRNRAKIEAAIANARAFLAVRREHGSFAAYLWRFVDGRPVQNGWRSLRQVPAESETSRALSRDLKRRAFRFVGPTICYAFMQAAGLVNDHTVGCFRWRQVQRRARPVRAAARIRPRPR